jgi:hypothetical protein
MPSHSVEGTQGDQKIRKKVCQIFQRIAPKVAKSKRPKYLQTPKHLHQTTFETLKYLQQTMLGKNVINLLKHKLAQKVAINLGYFILSKNHNEPSMISMFPSNITVLSRNNARKQLS